jgi:transposase InsO family protein
VDFISDIIHRFGFPHTIITDLGSNFTSQSFWDFCDNSCIKVKYALVAHPQANGKVERINGLVLDDLKKETLRRQLQEGWKVDPRNTPCGLGAANAASKATGQSPFFLTYGSEAILPANIMWKSPRVEAH